MKMAVLAMVLLGSCRCDRQTMVVVQATDGTEAGPEALVLPVEAKPPLPALGSVESDPASVARQVEDLKQMGLGHLVDAGGSADVP